MLGATALLAALAAPAPAALGGATTAARSHSVSLRHIAFSPSHLSIRHGERVTWRWHDGSIPHNVVGKGFASRTQSHGSFSVTFKHKGTYSYVCTLHSNLRGKIVVR
jgi:plastocyanin